MKTTRLVRVKNTRNWWKEVTKGKSCYLCDTKKGLIGTDEVAGKTVFVCTSCAFRPDYSVLRERS